MKPHCLVIEDDNTLQGIYKFLLQRTNFEVTFAKDGQEAMDILKWLSPHLVFLDVRLPYVNGVDILQFMRSDARFAETRIIITSSMNDYEGNMQHEEFILKPLHPNTLAQIIDETYNALLHLV